MHRRKHNKIVKFAAKSKFAELTVVNKALAHFTRRDGLLQRLLKLFAVHFRDYLLLFKRCLVFFTGEKLF